MAHRDLGRFYQSVGDYTAALKHFTKIRESCTTSQHVVDMCIAILEVEPSHPGLFSPSIDNVEPSFSFCRATTLTSLHTSLRPTPHSMLRQMPHQQPQLPPLRVQDQQRKARRGPNGKRNLTLRALFPILDKETTKRQRISS